MEPWDGPASIAFTDGTVDRRGARPQRPAPEPLLGHRRRPRDHGERGRRASTSTPRASCRRAACSRDACSSSTPRKGRIVDDDEIKARARGASSPYGEWLDAGPRAPRRPARPRARRAAATSRCVRRQETFGYTHEELKLLVAPMARTGGEALGSMGTDTPIAVLSDRPRMLFDYFQQLFAQVTNPPLDAIREELVTSLSARTIGPEGNLLEPGARVVRADRAAVPDHRQRRAGQAHPHRPTTATVPSSRRAVHLGPLPGRRRRRRAARGARPRARRGVGRRSPRASASSCSPTATPTPSGRRSRRCCSPSAVHHHLIREKTRTQVGLVVEAGDAREVHHMALLVGYGAGAINPYLAFESIEDLIAPGPATASAASTRRRRSRTTSRPRARACSR